MALINFLTVLFLVPLISANTVQFNIARSPSAQTAQLRAREASLRGRALNKRGLFERADSVTAELTNARTQGLYFANVTVGTPAQALALQIDTGSSDVWVPAAEAALCSNAREGGCPNGQCELFSFSLEILVLDLGEARSRGNSFDDEKIKLTSHSRLPKILYLPRCRRERVQYLLRRWQWRCR